MVYYFNRYSLDDYDGCPATKMKYLRESVFRHLKIIAKKLSAIKGLDLSPFWVSKSTLGAVLCDYIPPRKGQSIVKSHKALFNLIQKEVDYLVLSQTIGRNLEFVQIGEKNVLVINSLRYKKFIDTFANTYTRIKLFLNKNLSAEEEDIINDWIDSKEKLGTKKPHVSAEDIIENLPKDNPEKASEIATRVQTFYDEQVIHNLKYYEEALDKFEEMLNDSTVLESELESELFNKMWIIDFRYNSAQFEIKNQLPIDNGRIDLWVSKSKTAKKKNVIIELKRANSKVIIKHRKKEAIGADVGRALSQVINYLEETKKKWQIQNGLIVIGREDKIEFIKTFNQYLHGIEVKTYKQLVEDCRESINGFKQPVTELTEKAEDGTD